MNDHTRIRQRLTAVLFLAALALGTALWLYGYFAPADAVGMSPPTRAQSLSDAFTNAEDIINDSMDRSHRFIQLYGGVQRLLGRRVIRDADGGSTVYKLSDGTLTFVNSTAAENLPAHADALFALEDTLAQWDIPLLYVQAPQKIGTDGAPTLPTGVTDYGNQNADTLLALLEQGGVSTLDLREVLKADGGHWTDYFFATDHHWTPQTALLCTRALVERLNGEYGMALDESLTDPAAFSAVTYKDSFLGSQGKRTGSWYAGTDDLTVLTPVYETAFTYSVPSTQTERSGSFGESLLFPERLEQSDLFQSNPYTVYSGGDYALARMVNHNNPDGPKLLLLRDSYSCALAPFLALHCSELITVDPRYFDGDLAACIGQEQPDLVIALYTPGAAANDTFFKLF